MNMNKTLTIAAIVMVAVVMGLSTVTPIMQYADASHGGPNLPDKACDALEKIPNPPPKLEELITEHCVEEIPPDSG